MMFVKLKREAKKPAPVGRDNPSEKQPEPNPLTGQRQPQKMPQTEPQELEKEEDNDIGGGD